MDFNFTAGGGGVVLGPVLLPPPQPTKATPRTNAIIKPNPKRNRMIIHP
jgi:hypothetical protein